MFYTPVTLAHKPVDDKERRAWERKREEKIAAAKGRSESEKAKIQADREKDQKERARFWDEFLKAFQFQTTETDYERCGTGSSRFRGLRRRWQENPNAMLSTSIYLLTESRTAYERNTRPVQSVTRRATFSGPQADRRSGLPSDNRRRQLV